MSNMSVRRKGIWIVWVIAVQAAFIILVHWSPDTSAVKASEESTDGLWNSPLRLSVGADNGAFIPVLKRAANGRLMVVYNQVLDNGSERPYYRVSLDQGSTWTAPKAIHKSGPSMHQVTFDFDKDNVANAVWRTEAEIWHARQGQWPLEANLVTLSPQPVFNPNIAVAPDGRLHVIWTNRENRRIYHSFSNDRGKNWTSPVVIGNWAVQSSPASITADRYGNVHVVWHRNVDLQRPEIRYRLGTATGSGINWASTTERISSTIAEPVQPSIQAQADYLHVAFVSRVSQQEQYVYYARYKAGTGWSAPVDVTAGKPVTAYSNVPFYVVPALTLCDGVPYIYFDGSLVFGAREKLLGVSQRDGWKTRDHVDVGNVRAIRPSVACADDKIHMVYERIDQTDDHHQVYYTAKFGNGVFLPMVRKG